MEDDTPKIARLLRELRTRGRDELFRLWPDRPVADFVRNPTSPAIVHNRVAEVEALLTKAARDGGGNFKRADVVEAQKAFDAARLGLTLELDLQLSHRVHQVARAHALPELQQFTRDQVLPGEATLYGTDLLKIEAKARSLGFSEADARAEATFRGSLARSQAKSTSRSRTATISPACRCRPLMPSPPPAPIGRSRIACTGSWTWPSAKTSPACARTTAGTTPCRFVMATAAIPL